MPTIITDGGSLARALSSPIDDRLKALLTKRRDQLGGDITDQARFVIVRPGDSPEQLEQVLSFSVFQNLGDGSWFGDPNFTPGWEWILQHDFGWELCFIFTDDGFAHVVIVMDEEGVDQQLLNLCATFATEHA